MAPLAAAALWLMLTLGAVLLVALLVWRSQVARRLARRRRQGRSLLNYLERRR